MSERIPPEPIWATYAGAVFLCYLTTLLCSVIVSTDDLGFRLVATVPYALIIGVLGARVGRATRYVSGYEMIWALGLGVTTSYFWTVAVYLFLSGHVYWLRVFEAADLYYWMVGGFSGSLFSLYLGLTTRHFFEVKDG